MTWLVLSQYVANKLWKNQFYLLFQVENQIAIELAYINTRHPEFDSWKCENLLRRDQLVGKQRRAKQKDTSVEKSKDSGNEQIVDFMLTNNLDSKSGNTGKPPINGEGKGITSGFFRQATPDELSDTSKEANFLPHVPEKPLARQLTDYELEDCNVIGNLVKSYFKIVRKNVQDGVPKAIMYFLVNYVRDSLQSELVRQLYQPELLDDLLTETQDTAQRRKQAIERMQALNQATRIISEVREIQLW